MDKKDEKKSGIDGYVEVSERITEFRKLYPNGSLQPADPNVPYRIETVGDKTFFVVVAAAYRTPEDPNPGIGMAMESFPGTTNFTRGSELQNAETSAWGRALVATLSVDTKRGIASADEVRLRTAMAAAILPPADFARAELMRLLNRRGIDSKAVAAKFAQDNEGDNLRTSTNEKAIQALLDSYKQEGSK